MEYIGFSFKNFKGIGDLDLVLAPGAVTTLIGLNESGKTTILEAIFCFSYGAENLDAIDPSMASLREPERWIPIAQRGNFNDSIEIRARVSLSDEDKRLLRKHLKKDFGLAINQIDSELDIVERYRFENSRYVADKTSRTWGLTLSGTKGSQRKPRTYDHKTPEWQAAIAFLTTMLPRIWYFPNFLFELPDRFMLEEAAAVGSPAEEADKNNFYRLTFEKILSQTGTGADLETHVVGRVKTGDKADERNLKSLLLDMARDITKTVFDGWNRIFGRTPIEQEVELQADTDEAGRAFLELKIKGPDGYYDLSERSLGFRWFFMFLLMTSYRGLAADGQRVVFLLDEPASNLHSSAQAELLKSFEALAKTCQLIYTTHSHHLINLKWLDSALVVKNEALGDLSFEKYMTESTASKTSISATPYRAFVAAHPDNTSYVQPVLDLLDYRPSDLEPVPDVVLVEGKSDFYLLRYAVDVLGREPAVKLVPGTGAGSLDPLIQLHIGWGKSFIVLLDDDAEGRRQKERYAKAFGRLIDGRCLTLGDLGLPANLREIEDVLVADDRDALMAAIYPAGSTRPAAKKALMHAVIELYGRREAVQLGTESLARLDEILATLSQTLGDQASPT